MPLGPKCKFCLTAIILLSASLRCLVSVVPGFPFGMVRIRGGVIAKSDWPINQ